VVGRPSLEDSNADKFAAVKAALAGKQGIRRIARELQTGVGTVLRIKSEMAACLLDRAHVQARG
jgi:hypothetical protein